MSENTTPSNGNGNGIDDIIISRNGVDLPLSKFKILKGDKKDSEYPAPKVEMDNLELFFKWYGIANVQNVMQNYAKRQFQIMVADSTDAETGVFNRELFIKYATDLSVAGLKIREINDKLDELQAQVAQIIDSDDLDDPTVKAHLKELNGQVRAYRQMREDKSRKPKAEAEPEPSVAVA